MARIALHIHAIDLGGAERVALQWCSWLQEFGHDVWLYCGTSPEQVFFQPPKGVQVVVCSEGVSTWRWLRRCLEDNPPDLAIGITTRPAINLLLARLGHHWPVWVAERNYPPARRLSLQWRFLRRCLYPSADLHLVQTQRIGIWLERVALAREWQLLPNSVQWPLPSQAPFVDPAVWLPPEAKVVLAVGTKPFQKGFDRLIKAFTGWADAHVDGVLVLLGVNDDHPFLQRLLEELGHFRSRVILPGRVGNLSCWYERADLFVLSSRFEGSPNVLLEAMAYGCACLAIDCPTGPRELLRTGVNGVLLPEQATVLDLANSIDTLLKDPPLRDRLGRNAVSIREQFSVEQVRTRMHKLLGPALEPKVMVLAPTRRSPTETFIRANLTEMPLRQISFFGDEFGSLYSPGQLAYGLVIFISKVFTRLGAQRLSTWLPSVLVLLLIRRHRPDVLLVEFGFHAVRVMEASFWSGVPLVVHFRGSDASSDRRLLPLSERYRRLMTLVQALFVKSEPMKQVLINFGANPDQITITPSGADSKLFYGASPASHPPVVLFVGRLVAKKGPLDALEAFVRARNRLEPAIAMAMRLRLIGDGPMRTALENRIEELDLSECVEMLGVRSPQEIADWMRRSRCLLLPSRTAPDGDSEGCPVVVLEAQLSGLPVISTFHAGIPEVVLNGETGLLSQEGDVEGLASALMRISRDPHLAARLGSAGRERVEAAFTVAHHIGTVAAVLRQQVNSVKINTFSKLK